MAKADGKTSNAPAIQAKRAPDVKEIHIVWMTTGLGCDGDSVSITAAMQPSVEDVVMGAIPGLPKVHLHNPVLAYEVGDDFMKYWYMAERGELDPFVLVLEGSVPNEKIKEEGYWAAMGTNADTGQPIKTTEWIDRLAPKALAVVAAGTCATYGGIHAMQGNPTGCMGLADYLGWDWKSKAGLPIVNVPGCPVQPDNFMETLLYLLYQVAGLAPMIPLDDQLRPTWLFERTVHEGCDRGGYYEQGQFAEEYGSPECLVKLGCWGPVVNCNVTKRGWMAGIDHARLPRQVHALHGRTARGQAFHVELHHAGPRHYGTAADHESHGQQGTQMAPHGKHPDDRVCTPVLIGCRAVAEIGRKVD
jgi:hydrogenase small subunit